MIRSWVAACAGALLIASPAVAQPISQSVENHDSSKGELQRGNDGFVHRSTGYVFPLQLVGLPAVKTVTYGPGDASVTYESETSESYVLLSTYVYPVALPLAEEADIVEESLLNAMPGTSVARPAALGAPPTGVVERWFHSRVKGEDVITGFRLIESQGYFIKVRLTTPRASRPATLDRGWRALEAVKWSLPGRVASVR